MCMGAVSGQGEGRRIPARTPVYIDKDGFVKPCAPEEATGEVFDLFASVGHDDTKPYLPREGRRAAAPGDPQCGCSASDPCPLGKDAAAARCTDRELADHFGCDRGHALGILARWQGDRHVSPEDYLPREELFETLGRLQTENDQFRALTKALQASLDNVSAGRDRAEAEVERLSRLVEDLNDALDEAKPRSRPYVPNSLIRRMTFEDLARRVERLEAGERVLQIRPYTESEAFRR